MTNEIYHIIKGAVQAVMEDCNGHAKDELYYAIKLIKENNVYTYSIEECYEKIKNNFASFSCKSKIIQSISNLVICLAQENSQELDRERISRH